MSEFTFLSGEEIARLSMVNLVLVLTKSEDDFAYLRGGTLSHVRLFRDGSLTADGPIGVDKLIILSQIAYRLSTTSGDVITKKVGEYYADLDVETGLYCVFHTETTKAYASYASLREAEDRAKEMNGGTSHDRT